MHQFQHIFFLVILQQFRWYHHRLRMRINNGGVLEIFLQDIVITHQLLQHITGFVNSADVFCKLPAGDGHAFIAIVDHDIGNTLVVDLDQQAGLGTYAFDGSNFKRCAHTNDFRQVKKDIFANLWKVEQL